MATARLPRAAWCGRRDSNPHILRWQDLNLLRLPIPPRPHEGPADRNPIEAALRRAFPWARVYTSTARASKGRRNPLGCGTFGGVKESVTMATQPPPETPAQPSQPVQPSAPPPEITPPTPDVDIPSPTTPAGDPGTSQPAEI